MTINTKAMKSEHDPFMQACQAVVERYSHTIARPIDQGVEEATDALTGSIESLVLENSLLEARITVYESMEKKVAATQQRVFQRLLDDFNEEMEKSNKEIETLYQGIIFEDTLAFMSHTHDVVVNDFRAVSRTTSPAAIIRVRSATSSIKSAIVKKKLPEQKHKKVHDVNETVPQFTVDHDAFIQRPFDEAMDSFLTKTALAIDQLVADHIFLTKKLDQYELENHRRKDEVMRAAEVVKGAFCNATSFIDEKIKMMSELRKQYRQQMMDHTHDFFKPNMSPHRIYHGQTRLIKE